MNATTTAFGYATNLPVDDPSSLVACEVALPDLAPHDLLVEVRAVSVNPVDVKQRAGASAHGFRVLGYDAAGVVREVGAQVDLFAPGDEVFYAGSIARPGSNQLLHAVDERIVGHRPRTLSFADSAGVPLVALTAWESVVDRLGLGPDSSGTLLVVGASGGVGSMLVQIVRVLAPRVHIVATASSDRSRAWVSGLGADATVDHHGDLAAQVLELAPGGVDWLFTAHSADQVPTYARIVAPYGHVVAIDGGPRDVAPLSARSIAWHWELMFTAPLHQPDSRHQHEILEQVAALLDEGRLRPITATVLRPFDAATLREGHRLVETGRTVGKVVVTSEPA